MLPQTACRCKAGDLQYWIDLTPSNGKENMFIEVISQTGKKHLKLELFLVEQKGIDGCLCMCERTPSRFSLFSFWVFAISPEKPTSWTRQPHFPVLCERPRSSWGELRKMLFSAAASGSAYPQLLCLWGGLCALVAVCHGCGLGRYVCTNA